MQYYTRQQLVGSGKYSQRVRIGNWNEDLTLQEVKLREYIAAKEAGALSMDKHAVRLRTALAEVELTTVKQDEYVHLGTSRAMCVWVFCSKVLQQRVIFETRRSAPL